MVLIAVLTVLCTRGTESGQGPADTGVCAEIQARFDKVRTAGSGVCKKNRDCGCYNPVSIKSGCGGVTDKETSDLLHDLQNEFHLAGCDWPAQCRAWICNPVCDRGHCILGNQKEIKSR